MVDVIFKHRAHPYCHATALALLCHSTSFNTLNNDYSLRINNYKVYQHISESETTTNCTRFRERCLCVALEGPSPAAGGGGCKYFLDRYRVVKHIIVQAKTDKQNSYHLHQFATDFHPISNVLCTVREQTFAIATQLLIIVTTIVKLNVNSTNHNDVMKLE